MKRTILNTFILAMGATTGAASAAVYRCQVDGETIFSQTPCAADAKEYDVDYVRADEARAERIKGDLEKSKEDRAASQTERKINSLRLSIKDAEADIRILNKRRSEDLAALQAKKSRANNNLAGATWEQSISAEMTAVNHGYDSQIDAKREQVKGMKAEVDELRGM